MARIFPYSVLRTGDIGIEVWVPGFRHQGVRFRDLELRSGD